MSGDEYQRLRDHVRVMTEAEQAATLRAFLEVMHDNVTTDDPGWCNTTAEPVLTISQALGCAMEDAKREVFA